jgi:hypothetical protein
MGSSARSKMPEKYARVLGRLSIETKLKLVQVFEEMEKERESWEQALRGDTSKLEARIINLTATPDEGELVCDLAAGRVNGKQYLQRFKAEIKRDQVAGHFQHILRDNPSAKLTIQLRKEVLSLYGIEKSLAAEIWAKVKNELAESTQV